MRVVAIEEHHVIPGVSNQFLDPARLPEAVWARLHPTVDQRLADMDAAGIETQVLSVVLPMPEQLPAEVAVPLAVKANTELQDMVAAHPDRFAAFAALPVALPDEAAAELERTVRDLGFVGTMISGSIVGEFLDRARFTPILDTAARLDAPIYLHPAPPPPPVVDAYYSGFDDRVSQALSTGGYGWHYESSLHALRLILSGAFDRLPDLKVILGHLGEGLAFHLHRIDSSLPPASTGLAKSISAYLREHFWFTTSGYFYDDPFHLTRTAFGDDRMIFSVDYPFADNRRGRDWFDQLDLVPDIREKIAHGTVDDLLHLTDARSTP